MNQEHNRANNISIYENRPGDFKPLVQVSACYVEVEGKILWLKRAADKLEGNRWGVPAGKLDPNETPEEAARRELFEETGIRLEHSLLRDLGALYIRKPEVDYVYHIFQILLDRAPMVSLSSEHLEYRWLPLDEAASVNLMSGAEEALQYYQKRKRIKSDGSEERVLLS